MSELFIVVGLRAKQGKEAELQRDLLTVAKASQHEEGSLRYELFVDQGDPGLFVFFEHWASLELQQKHHTQGPHILHFHANGLSNVERKEFAHVLSRIA